MGTIINFSRCLLWRSTIYYCCRSSCRSARTAAASCCGCTRRVQMSKDDWCFAVGRLAIERLASPFAGMTNKKNSCSCKFFWRGRCFDLAKVNMNVRQPVGSCSFLFVFCFVMLQSTLTTGLSLIIVVNSSLGRIRSICFAHTQLYIWISLFNHSLSFI